jgi:hypothetical protein
LSERAEAHEMTVSAVKLIDRGDTTLDRGDLGAGRAMQELAARVATVAIAMQLDVLNQAFGLLLEHLERGIFCNKERRGSS